MNNIDNLIKIAKKDIGVKESPKNSNKQKFGEAYGWNGVAWCVQAQWYWFKESGLSNYFYGGDKTASCSQLVSYHKKLNQVIYSGYKKGDLILFNFNGKKSTEHIGLCIENDGKNITTIDGNTGTTNESNGGAVMIRKRALKYVVCGIRWSDKKVMDNKYLSEIDVKLNILQKGCIGSLVKTLQILLNNSGENCGEIDGSFGPQVMNSLKLYQAKNNLESDGSCGPATWTKLLRGE